MKKYMIFAAIAAAVLAAGCAKESLIEPEQGTVLNASLSTLTKTAIDGVKVTWTEGDAINVNGANSYPITEAAATAKFEFKTALTAPYKAVYPTSIYKDASTVTLPANLEAGAVFTPLAGYLESGDAISFKALTAFLKISLTGEATTTVKDLTLKGLGGEQLSGDFAIDFATLALTGSSTADADKVVKVNINQALSATPLVLYVPIPAGNYASGYQVDILDSEGGLMRKAVTARTVKAGELRDMGALAFEVNVTEDPNIGGIPDAKEFKDFAAAVNEGRSFNRWINESTGAVELLADIDFEGAEWVPVGNATVTTGHAITGNAFTGVFDGKNHTVDNFTVTVPATGANAVAGLFGAISGATVKNLVIGQNVVIKSSSNTGFVTMGAAVGFASESTLENIDSYAKMVNDAGKDNIRLVVGGAVGTLFSSADVATTAKNIKGHASFDVVNTVNTKNGGTGFIVGGVIGFTDGKNVDNVPVKIENAINYSDFSVQATRTAGVIGTMNSFTIAEGCVNYGNISCTDVKASNSRVAGIVSAMGNSTALKGCVNYGDVAFAVSEDSTHGYAGGVVGQNNDANSFTYLDGCANYGAVQSDRWFASGDDKYMGIISGNFNTKVMTVKNCIVGGKIGPYTPTTESPVVTITADNFTQYYCLVAAARIAKVTFENNTFGTYTAPGIKTAEDLKAFAAAVNAGTSLEAWTDAEGVVVLAADIDLDGVTEWIPIGNAATTSNGNYAAGVATGKAFTGVFDGKGHTIRNFKPTVSLGAQSTWGLFGFLSNATVKNLNVETAVNLSATDVADAGIIAGTAACSTIENVKVSGTITSSGSTVNNKRFAIGGIAGFLFCQYDATEKVAHESFIKNCEVTATVNIDGGTNMANGAGAVMYGGIVGFATKANENTDGRNHIQNCVNNGTMTVKIGRCSGIVATCNRATYIEGCTNNASQVNTVVNGRIGQIVCNMSNYSAMIDCVNTGNLTTTDSQTTTGALVALCGHNSCYIKGGTRVANTGTILGGNTANLGLLAANISACDYVKDIILSGRLGVYKSEGDPEMYEVTNENIMTYIGTVGSSYKDKVTGISYVNP